MKYLGVVKKPKSVDEDNFVLVVSFIIYKNSLINCEQLVLARNKTTKEEILC